MTRLQQLFHQCLELEDPQQRDKFLESLEHGEDQGLVPGLRALLHADAALAAQLAPSPPLPADPAVWPRFGAYQTERVIGRGGMGVVYLARRADGMYQQTAAIKVISGALHPEFGTRRFLRERQFLADLRHTGIAQMLDGGVTSEGTPYLVMEYIEGQRLDAYCNAKNLGIRERVDLLRALCRAVAYAHRNLVIHCDLKPSNILVNAEGVPKLVDFGTARLAQAAEATVTFNLVTPRYASPEQLRNQKISTATDIFSLGVVMAELLTGRWPFGDPDSQSDALRRAVDDPTPLPLDRAVTSDHAAHCGGANTGEVRAALRGDLSAIAAKCLKALPEDRYTSVADLDEDLRRYLANEPVSARPLDWWYPARKFVQRNALSVAASALAVLGLVSMSIFSFRQAAEAQQAADRAVLARLAFDSFLSSFTSTSTLGEIASHTQRQLANQAYEPSVKNDLLYSAASLLSTAADFPAAAKLLRQSVAGCRQAKDAFCEALAQARLASILTQLGDMQGGAQAAREAFRLSSGKGLARTVVRMNAVQALLFDAAYGRSIPPDIEQLIGTVRAFPEGDPFTDEGFAGLYNSIAAIRSKQNRPTEEQDALKKGLEWFRKRPSTNGSLILESWRVFMQKQGDYAGAARYARERLAFSEETEGPEHLLPAYDRLGLAQVLVKKGELAEARQQANRALATYEKFGPERGAVINWRLFTTLAFVAGAERQGSEAERWARQALALNREMDRQKDSRVADGHLHLGDALRLQGRFTEAAQSLTHARTVYLAAGSAFAPRVEECTDQLAMAARSDRALYPRHFK